MLLDRFLIESAGRRPEKTAVVAQDGSRASYGSLLSSALRIASFLRSEGLRRGDRVVIALENSVEYVYSFFGALHAGCTAVPVNHLTTAHALLKVLTDCSPRLIIAKARFIEAVQRLPEASALRFICVDGDTGVIGKTVTGVSDCMASGHEKLNDLPRDMDDLASIIYTSGTTGEPKGVMLSHGNLYSNSSSIIDYLGLSGDDSVMAVLPFFYSYGNSLLLTHFKQGGTLVIDNRFLYPNTVLDRMRSEEVTGFAGVPSTFAILRHRSNFRNMSFPSLRYITQAGGPMPHDMAVEILKTVPHVRLYIMYGQTEASARLSYLPPGDLHRKPGSIGMAIPGVTLHVLDEAGSPVKPGEAGEIVAEGQNIMAGYWGSPEETAEVLRRGRLHTGDMATVDEEGYIYIVGRKRDIIKSGAHRIAPRDIEEVLLKDPGVFEAAVVGVEDPILGEAICAFIVVKDGAACSESGLMRLCHENLPLYKMPKQIRFIESIPKTGSMKVKKEELRKILSGPAEVAK